MIGSHAALDEASRRLMMEIGPVWGALSTGRRNTLVESLRWRVEVQCFSGPLVELARHRIELGLRVGSEVGSSGKVLSQKPIGIFV